MKELRDSIIWAFVVLVIGFLGFAAFLIASDHSEDLQRVLILIGQGFLGALNLWAIYRSSLSTNKKVDSVQETINGNTPPPGTLPKVER